jgi:hypothetical protein
LDVAAGNGAGNPYSDLAISGHSRDTPGDTRHRHDISCDGIQSSGVSYTLGLNKFFDGDETWRE